MKYAVLLLCALFAALPVLQAASADVIYDSSAADPNPVTQGWVSSDTTEPGTDGDTDGRIDFPANVGPVAAPGGVAWQIHDQLTDGAFNLPGYQRFLTRSELGAMYYDGWVFEFTVKSSNLAPGPSGFTSWGLALADDPGWGLSGSTRVGFWVGQDADGNFYVEPNGGTLVSLGAGSIDDFHTIRAVGLPESSEFEWFIDGASQGTIDFASYTIASDFRGVQFVAG
ncbi:hypothetical protein, partial [Haloferula sp.]|uniref:hypothetical protein n=1 Tax=Haloferula sp. TaxID=2497595 RepID=UPI003C77A65A